MKRNYNPALWFQLIFHPYSKRVLKTLLPALVVLGIYAAILGYVHLEFFDVPSLAAVHSLLGVVLGLFLVFRTNSSYDRWWEGRKLWGSLVNSSRNLAMKLNAVLSPEMKEERAWFATMIINFTMATKEHLRNGVDMKQIEGDDRFMKELLNAEHKPNFIVTALYSKTNELLMKNNISGFHFINLDKEMKDFIDIIGGCERIKKTPIPYSYAMFIKKFIFIYIITLPFGFIHMLGYYTVPVVMFVAYVLVSLELIGEEIEDPFGKDINDLPTDDISDTIKNNVTEILLG